MSQRPSMFWKLCALWGLALGSVALIRPHLQEIEVRQLPPRVPFVGEAAYLPPMVQTWSGELISSLDPDRPTFFLVAGASCPVCQRELPTYGDLLLLAESQGLSARMLLVPGSDEDTELFMDAAPEIGTVVLDTLDMAFRGLRTRVTPSAVIVSVDGTITAAFSPPDGWPLTAEAIAAGTHVGNVPPTGRR